MAETSCSAVLVVRDEAATLGDCLRSIRDLVDEIVVLDTGSSDDTRDIAQDAGARVIRSRWLDDFSLVRNEASSHARGDWIFSIDADERVVRGDRAYLHSLTADTSASAFRVWLRPGPMFTRSLHWRLFRNDPRIRFEGRIRESVAPSIRRLSAAPGGPAVRACEIAIDHSDEPVVRGKKHVRDLALLRQALAEHPDNVVYWTDLGRALDAIGQRDEALEAWERAVAIVRRDGATLPSATLPFTDMLQRLPEHDARRPELLDEATARFPDDPLVTWLRAETLVGERSFSEALPLLELLSALDADADVFPELSYDRRIFGEFAYAALAHAHAGLGRWGEAADWYERAARLAPGTLEYRTKEALARARRNTLRLA